MIPEKPRARGPAPLRARTGIGKSLTTEERAKPVDAGNEALKKLGEGHHERRVAGINRGFEAQMRRFERLRAANEEYFRGQCDRLQESKGNVLAPKPRAAAEPRKKKKKP